MATAIDACADATASQASAAGPFYTPMYIALYNKIGAFFFSLIFASIFQRVFGRVFGPRKSFCKSIADDLDLMEESFFVKGGPPFRRLIRKWRFTGLVMGRELRIYVDKLDLIVNAVNFVLLELPLHSRSKLRMHIRANTLLEFLNFDPLRKQQSMDAKLDSKVCIRCNNGALSKIIFASPEIRQALLDVFTKHKCKGVILIENGLLRFNDYGGYGKKKKRARLMAMAKPCAMLAEAIDIATCRPVDAVAEVMNLNKSASGCMDLR
jgi:hypothetical protein